MAGWSDGQTLTAAIGQSYNLFTPLQLANYIATLVGNGEHYAAHLLKNVKTYNNSAVVYAYDKDPVNVVEMQDSTVEAIKTGMHDLNHREPVHLLFQVRGVRRCQDRHGETRCPTDANNGTFVCFRPLRRSPDRCGGGHREGRRRCGSGGDGGGYPQRLLQWEEIGTAIIGENTLLN